MKKPIECEACVEREAQDRMMEYLKSCFRDLRPLDCEKILHIAIERVRILQQGL